MSNLDRKSIGVLWPEGPAWDIEHGSDTDKTLDGVAEFYAPVRQEFSGLASLRNPTKTAYLQELEQEYGVTPRSSQADRRAYLDGYIFADNNGSIDTLQDALYRAGFGVTVYDNDPVVDPASILETGFQLQCGGDNAYAGDPEAYCGTTGGELLVNGEQIFYEPLYLSVCGDMYAGDPDAVCGRFNNSEPQVKTYPIPTDSDSWPFLFFVGGEATRDTVTDEITFIEPAEILLGRKFEFERIILKYKPLFTWAGLVITYV
ncbi:hypothetical protein GWN42_31330 [candidate division KSB1 bacterium]|nr:hypothetical protein [Phycisphaerae bacterium]NIQ92552.1 hypothetical protein [Deltaproteobacteria bacterium]NIV97162.1 hypothetical protein [candidate division KSB1 bacterium]